MAVPAAQAFCYAYFGRGGVGPLSSTDADSGDTFTHALVSGSDSTDNTSFAITVVDNVPHTLVSIIRQLPSTAQLTNSTSAIFRVTFSEPVNTPTTSNFAIAAVGGSSIVGTIASVTSVSGSPSVYDFAVTITAGVGEFRLPVKD